VEAAGRRAIAQYVTPASPCRATLFRAIDARMSFYGRTFWSRLAEGGVDLRPIVGVDIRHDNILDEPYVGGLAAELDRSIERALATRPSELAEEAVV
jgi:hypothetical protein